MKKVLKNYKCEIDIEINSLRTELVFNIGNKLAKLAKYQLNRLNNNNSKYLLQDKLYSLFKIIYPDKILVILERLNQFDVFELGHTVVKLLQDKTKVVKISLKTINDRREIIISINDEYLQKLNISCNKKGYSHMDLLMKIHLITLVLIRKPAYKYFQNEFKKKIFSREDYNTRGVNVL